MSVWNALEAMTGLPAEAFKREYDAYTAEQQAAEEKRIARRIGARPALEVHLKKRRVGDRVRERVLRLNPNPREGEMFRGWHPRPTVRKSLNRDVVTRECFDRRWGKGASRRLGKDAFLNAGGKRRWITGIAMMQGPA